MQKQAASDYSSPRRLLKTAVFVSLVSLIAGCSSITWNWPEEPGEQPVSEDAVTVEPSAAAEDSTKAATRPAKKTRSSRPAAPQPPSDPHVAIVLSNDIPAYQGVADELVKRLIDTDYSLHQLDGSFATAEAVFSDIDARATPYIVAIGFNAARLASQLSDSPVIFCQVFNFQRSDFHPDRVRGVSAIPPLALQLQAWKELDPTLKSVGAILGDGHDDLISAAQEATDNESVQLHHRTARSDRETLYLFKRLAPQIDGFWLFPDNRVLSPTVIDQISMYAARHSIQLTVFLPSMLKLGAVMSASSIQSDIADTVLKVLERMRLKDIENVPTITQLSEVDIRINTLAANRFGLLVPADYDRRISAR